MKGIRLGVTTTLLLLLAFFQPIPVQAAKCDRVLPKEVFLFFNDKPGKIDCADYEYKLIDLNDDEQLEVTVTNYRRSCEDVGYCNFEIFEKSDGKWRHIGSIPGRIRLLETKTKAYYDLATWLLGHRYVYIWDGATYRDIMHAGDASDKNEKKTTNPTPASSPTPVSSEP